MRLTCVPQVRVGLLSLTYVLVSFLSISAANAQFGPAPSCSNNQIGGIIYRDFNANGVRDVLEPGQIAIRATAYDAANTAVGTALSDIDGAYRIDLPAAVGAVRVQFTELPSYLKSGPSGAQSLTTVAFPTAGNCAVNFGLSNAQQFCQENPRYALPCFTNGDPLASTSAPVVSADGKSVVEFDYNASGTGVVPQIIATNGQVGPVWGAAFQRSTKLLFVSAFQKRHVGFGPGGTGAIYAIDRSDPANPVASLFVDLKTLGIDTGNDPHTGLSGDATAPSHDNSSFENVGKIALGDIDLSEDEQTLWVMNLFNRTLYSLQIGNPAHVPGISDVQAFPIPNPGCSNNDFVAFGLKAHDGALYVGVNCTAETSQLATDLQAYVLKLSGGTFSTVFQLDLSSYTKGYGIHPFFNPLPDTGQHWKPWARTILDMFTSFPQFAFIEYPQPIVSGIEFDNDGSIVLNVMDRSGHQFGPFNYNVSPFDDSFVNAPSAGDILRLCAVGSGIWTLENNASCPGHAPTAGANNGEGPGGGEYYFEDRITFHRDGQDVDVHQETTTGSTAIKPGDFQALSISFDVAVVEDGGVSHFDNSTGAVVDRLQVYAPSSSTFGKAAGLGDIELLCNPAPVEIGNRVWRDQNGNGRQDADDPGIAGVTVHLYDSATNVLLATKVTDASGTYIFGAADGVYPGGTYKIRLDNGADYASGGPLGGLVLTIDHFAAADIDSDAKVVDGFATVNATAGAAGANDHTFDFGFGALECTQKDLGVINVKIDGNSGGLSKLVSKSVSLRALLAKQLGKKLCKPLSKAQSTQLVKLAKALYLESWQGAWSFGTVTNVCESPLSVCVTADIGDVLTKFSANTTTLKALVDKALNGNGCSKGTSKLKKTYLKQASAMAAKIDDAVAQLQALNPLVKCN